MALGNLFEKLKKGLEKTRQVLSMRVSDLFRLSAKVDDEFLAKLEEILIGADVGVETTHAVIADLRAAVKAKKDPSPDAVYAILKDNIARRLRKGASAMVLPSTPPAVILVAGVNGTGKTTSIAKLGHYYSAQGKKVLLAASDTFRAAACEQLAIWAERVKVDIVKHQMGSDPAAVAYDACDAAIARKTDVVIVDTAGRLHTSDDLMRELAKISKVLGKKIPGAPHEVLLVLDATAGQNALAQARAFKAAINATGIFLAKLDGTAKGGSVVAICDKIGIPVKFVGIGEKCDDIEPFDADRFAQALFE